VLVGGTAAISVGLGALAGDNLLRSIAVGYYLLGGGILLCSFALGIRGPMRAERSVETEDPVISTPLWSSLRPSGRRSLRKATPEERRGARRESLGLFVFGLLIILLGTAFDPTRRAF
jgi:hypothetical protein